MTSAFTTTVRQRHPMTALGKLIFGIALFLGSFALLGGIFTHSISLYGTATVNILLAALIFVGVRWAPIVGAVVSGAGVVYALAFNPYPAYHLSHPSDPLFVPIVIVMGLSIMATAAMVAAIGQNYWTEGRRVPRWFGFFATGMVGAVIGGILIGAIAQPTTTTTATANDGAYVVHLGVSTFTTTAINIPTGAKIKFVDDSNIEHILSYGTWNGTHLTAETPVGAPTLENHQIAGGSFELGPFTTAGTYRILCTVHPGMVLTVTVA